MDDRLTAKNPPAARQTIPQPLGSELKKMYRRNRGEQRMRSRGFRSFILLSTISAVVGLGPASSTAFAQVCPTAWEREVVALYNQERADAGLPPLIMDVRLVQSARGHSEDMAIHDYFSHVSLDGTTFDKRILAAGYPSPRSENIAAGYSTPASVVTAWMGSAGHRANILDSTAKHVGIGYAYQSGSTYGHYWTANMGTSSGSPQLPPPVCATLRTNASSFSTGESISVSLQADNFGDPSTVDFYFGAVLPDGTTVLLIVDGLLHRQRVSASDVSDWTPVASGVNLASPFTITKPNFLNYVWAGTEPAGTYTFFLTAAVPGSFADGTVDPGDIIHSSTATIAFAP